MTWTVHAFRPAGFILGVDLGQSNDYTALGVIERVNEVFQGAHEGAQPDQFIKHHHLRHAQRLPLGTSYPDVVSIVRHMMLGLPREGGAPQLVVDGTGVGKPVLDMMRKAGLKPVGVAITGGREENSGGDFNYSVPKRNLVSSLLIAFQEGRLKLSAGVPAITQLEQELLNFKAKISATGHDTYDAWRESIHDDLVLATALAVWWGEKRAEGPRQISMNIFAR